MQIGWICPKCARAVAPKEDHCPSCDILPEVTFWPRLDKTGETTNVLPDIFQIYY